MLCISKQAYRISLAVQFPCLSRWQWIYRSMRKYLEIASQWCHMQSRESGIDSSTVLCTMTVRHSLWKCCCCVSINWWQVVLGESGHVTVSYILKSIKQSTAVLAVAKKPSWLFGDLFQTILLKLIWWQIDRLDLVANRSESIWWQIDRSWSDGKLIGVDLVANWSELIWWQIDHITYT